MKTMTQTATPALQGAQTAVALPANVSGGAGTADNPYVLKSNSGTVTLISGKYYTVPDNITIGTAPTSVDSTHARTSNDATGGLVVNGAYVEISSGASVNGTIDMSASGSSLKLDATSSWSYTAYNPNKASLGGTTVTWNSIKGAVVSGLVNSDGSANTNVSVVVEGVDTSNAVSKIYEPFYIAGTTSTGSTNGSEFILGKAQASNGNTANLGFEIVYPNGAQISNNKNLSFNTTKNSKTGEYTVNNSVYTCFLAGTMILMADGSQRAVEEIGVGDAVAVLVDGERAARDVIWVGRHFAHVRNGLADDEAGYPVRIRAGAMAENTPERDLLVTAEHCLFVNNRFVPVRMLVNGGSIAYDRSHSSYFYYHVETADHSVIFAEGCATESFLDTGHRRHFDGSDNILSFLPKTWAQAAVPLAVDRAFVEPVHSALSDRSASLGYEVIAPAQTTTDSDLHLLTDAGMKIRPVRFAGGNALFMLPEGVESVHLVSRSARPSDAEGVFVDDRRELGVLVGKVSLWQAASTHVITSHLSGNAAGWYAPEGQRSWSAGYAQLPLEQHIAEQGAMLSVEILAGGPYLLSTEQTSAALYG